MTEKKVHPLTEDWDVFRQPGKVLVKRRGIATRQGVLDTIGYLARRLRTNTLRARDREYLADLLDKIAKDESFLPKRPSRKRGPTDLDFLNAYERLKDYKKVAKQFGIAPSTVEKRCSQARSFLKNAAAARKPRT